MADQRTDYAESISGEYDPVESSSSGASSSLRGKVGSTATSLFSLKFFGVALVGMAVGLFVVGGFIPFFGSIVGMAVAAFALGLASSQHRIVETAAAGLVVSGVASLLHHLVLTALGIGVPLVVLGAVVGLVVGGAGAYFGHDLRKGLTEPL